MAGSAPFEMIAAPFEVYIAPVGTTFPLVDATPAAAWVLMGTNGIINQVEGGVKVEHSQTTVDHFTEGQTGPVKATRTREMLKISFALADLSPAQYGYALRGETPTSVVASGTDAAYDYIDLYRGLSVNEYAMVIRGNNQSPLATSGSGNNIRNAQYNVPRCYQSGNATPIFRKSELAGVAFEFTALVDPSASREGTRFGQFLAQDGN